MVLSISSLESVQYLEGKPRFGRILTLYMVTLIASLFGGCGHRAEPQANPEKPGEIEVQSAAERYDLGRDEARGGHTLEKHVAHTDEQLRARLERESNIAAASTWTDRVAAETVVAEALHAERTRIDSWMRRGGHRPNLALHYDAHRVIGRSLQRGATQVVDCTRAVMVLRADGPNGFYVLTAYPENRK